jgi:hypothetical protein
MQIRRDRRWVVIKDVLMNIVYGMDMIIVGLVPVKIQDILMTLIIIFVILVIKFIYYPTGLISHKKGKNNRRNDGKDAK